MTIRISMFSGPRNISTTMMRAFENRCDTTVIDEPFYAVYLKNSGANHPFREEVLKTQPNTANGVIEWINIPGEESYRFLKHIAYHQPDETPLDFLLDHKVFLLIRNPHAMVASYADKFDDVAPIAKSLKIERRILEFLTLHNRPCPVVDASDILKAPDAMLRALCAAHEMPFDAAMLSWPAGARVSDGVWGPHWYDAVAASTGFRPPVEKPLALSSALEAVAEACMADYNHLWAQRLRI